LIEKEKPVENDMEKSIESEKQKPMENDKETMDKE